MWGGYQFLYLEKQYFLISCFLRVVCYFLFPKFLENKIFRGGGGVSFWICCWEISGDRVALLPSTLILILNWASPKFTWGWIFEPYAIDRYHFVLRISHYNWTLTDTSPYSAYRCWKNFGWNFVIYFLDRIQSHGAQSDVGNLEG